MSSELKKRIISAIVMAVAVILLTYFGGLPFRIFVAILTLLIFFEWSTIVRKTAGRTTLAIAWILTITIALLIIFQEPQLALAAIVLGGVFVALIDIARNRSAWLGSGIFYAGLAGVSLAELRGDGFLGLLAMIFVFLVVWGTDVLAYFCGRALGGPKLMPHVSPNKTWSGALGGTAAGVAVGTAVIFFVQPGGATWIPILAFILSVASQCGDLFESFVKRRFNRKDSSNLIPGHGGVMDRADGLIFAAIVAFTITIYADTAAETPVTSVAARLLAF